MRKIEILKLTQLSKAELKARQMNMLFGGGTPGNCSCGCYQGNTDSNCTANDNSGYTISIQNPETAGCCSCNTGYNVTGVYSISNPTY